ncbi:MULTISPECIES: hypothetical protein [Streptomyces]|uniref:hypothetical protein n=1 Tax=Streptomyces lycopersici TaxID=2974589 RepID=UPI0021CEC260|nr:hypothetical protein [Streptomyces sp. NEAU-383]
MKSRVALALSAAAVALTTVLAAPAALAATAGSAGKSQAAVPTAQVATLPVYQCLGIGDEQQPQQVYGVNCTPNNWPDGHFVMQSRERTYACAYGYYAFDGSLVGNDCRRLY